MDELKLNLSSKLMKGVVTKLIAVALQKKLGYKIDIQLNDVHATVIDGKAHIHVDMDGEIDKDEFLKIIKSVGLG